ncbi:MAG: regulatory protein RecX [Methylococcales symbiont of Hymedesmia sp. n. MRB-2018]|nr:MAG: regulatory protein RecX [Methylococcales symbiont of Hymedesmia sp. n. MRB-2018]
MTSIELSQESKEIKEICLRLLTRREHSQKELRDKLALRGFDHSQTQGVIDALKQQGWQSDQRFFESYARHRIKKGFGPIKIKADIQKHGIQSIDLEAVLLELADDWLEILEQAYSKKYAEDVMITDSERMKRSRFLLQRGFSGEMIMKFFQRIENKDRF